MADARPSARVRTDARRAFELQPVRSRASRWAFALVWTALAGGAGAAASAWALRGAEPACPVVEPDVLQTQLTTAQLALEQERAARTALQQSADAAQAQVAKAQAELLFLRSHGGARGAGANGGSNGSANGSANGTSSSGNASQ
ncbi:hypothetical protein [Paraburkholderia sp. J94]|uniref:hypothetical protein n=1 Tax=Paraburkholderia sp. J94 TaxID=2805441 RepID=UPI002AB12001|nr:hypothetical protein [Paraburkholderia sp. J94]